ncbi:MAG: glycoside hydrolase family 9 protein [Candidatus Latescibacterota bacterium]
MAGPPPHVATVPGEFASLLPLSDRVVRLAVGGAMDSSLASAAAGFELVAGAESGAAVHPQAVGLHATVGALGGEWNAIRAELRNEVFLLFATPMQQGVGYVVRVDNTAMQEFAFTYDAEQHVNGSVKTNQVGYLPQGPKYGYVGNYLGTAGMMPIAPDTFEVRHSDSGETAFAGRPGFRGEDLRLSGELVYECDFTALRSPGSYYLYVPGVGRSHEFRIGADVYDEVFRTLMRALYYQRCGMALEVPHADARFVRGACHLDDAYIHAAHAQSPLYGGEEIGSRVPMTGGWHDAGDYGKYVPTAAAALSYLFTAYELYPSRFADGAFDIPESGNGVPDLLDEARWEILWLKAMQAPDGGVYHKVNTVDWPETMPDNDTARRWVAPKSTQATGQFAAVMAMAYRHFLPYWTGLAFECLERSERAWRFLEAHPRALPEGGFRNPEGIGGGEYRDPDGDADERAWAAAELFKSTGDARYDSAFVVHWSQHPPGWGWNEFQHHQKRASWVHATNRMAQRPEVDRAFGFIVRQNAEANLLVRTEQNAYRDAYRADVAEWIGWGAFAQSTRYAWELILAQHLLGRPEYEPYALLNLDVQLGNNPQSQTYITGIGEVYPRDPLHHPSVWDGVGEPVPGLPVFGPHTYLTPANPFFSFVRAKLFPSAAAVSDPYPLLRRYVDSHKLVEMSEFTILEIAQAAAVFAAYASYDAGEARARPRTSGDFDGDGTVDLDDFFLFAQVFGSDLRHYDLDESGRVDLEDFFLFVDAYTAAGRGVAAGRPAAGREPGLALEVSMVPLETGAAGRLQVLLRLAEPQSVQGMFVHVAYDPAALEWEPAAVSRGRGTDRPLVVETQPGQDIVARLGQPPVVAQDGELASLTFRVLPGAATPFVAVEGGAAVTSEGPRRLAPARVHLPEPGGVTLYPGFPNPFNGSTQISFSLERAGPLSLTVYDVLGQRVRTLLEGPGDPGLHRVAWDGRDEAGRPAASGLYVCRLATAGVVRTQRLMLLQ